MRERRRQITRLSVGLSVCYFLQKKLKTQMPMLQWMTTNQLHSLFINDRESDCFEHNYPKTFSFSVQFCRARWHGRCQSWMLLTWMHPDADDNWQATPTVDITEKKEKLWGKCCVIYFGYVIESRSYIRKWNNHDIPVLRTRLQNGISLFCLIINTKREN